MSSNVARLGRPRYGAFAVSVLVVWLLLAALAWGLRGGAISHDLGRRATASVATSGTGVSVTYDGVNATLHGTFPDAAALARARAKVAGLDGTRSVTLGSDVRVARVTAVRRGSPRPVTVVADRGGLRVTATVPDQAGRLALIAAAAGLTTGPFTADITVDPAAAPVAASVVVGLARTALARTGGTTTADASLAAAITAGPIRFATGSAALDASDRARLDGIAAAVRSAGPSSGPAVLLAGHADATGPASFNMTLSSQRADSAAAYLRERGVAADLVTTVFYGAGRPLASNATAAGRAANRSVEITAISR